jgi:autophagy-related protein 18
VHIFKLERSGMSGERSTNHNVGQKSGDENWMGYLKNTVSAYLPYALPTQVTDVFTQGRAFASATLQVSGLKHSCAITTVQKSLR